MVKQNKNAYGNAPTAFSNSKCKSDQIEVRQGVSKQQDLLYKMRPPELGQVNRLFGGRENDQDKLKSGLPHFYAIDAILSSQRTDIGADENFKNSFALVKEVFSPSKFASTQFHSLVGAAKAVVCRHCVALNPFTL